MLYVNHNKYVTDNVVTMKAANGNNLYLNLHKNTFGCYILSLWWFKWILTGKQLSEKKIPPFVQAFLPVAVCWGILLIIMALRIYCEYKANSYFVLSVSKASKEKMDINLKYIYVRVILPSHEAGVVVFFMSFMDCIIDLKLPWKQIPPDQHPSVFFTL